MSDAELLWEHSPDGVATLTLNRPGAGNALSPTLRQAVIDRLHEAGRDPRVRVVVLTASGTRHFFFGDDLPAVEAERWGLVNEVVPADKLADVARAWAERLAAGPTLALSLGKRLVNHALDHDRAASFTEEAMAAEINMSSHDGQEGLRAFLERRSPEFRGW